MTDERTETQERFLARLTASQCRAHCLLAGAGVLECPPRRIWRRAARAPLVELFSPEWELLALLQDAQEELSEDGMERLHLAILWRYFRTPGLVDLFGRPDAERRMVAWTAARLRRPDLCTPAQVEAELSTICAELWETVIRRIALHGRSRRAPARRERAASAASTPIYH